MTNGDATVRRTLRLRFTLAGADPAQVLALVQAAKPFYEMLGGKSIRLYRNVDDPSQFIQIIEYETHEAFEINRQRLASDLRMQGYLQTWRAMFGGAIDFDVYEEVVGS